MNFWLFFIPAVIVGVFMGIIALSDVYYGFKNAVLGIIGALLLALATLCAFCFFNTEEQVSGGISATRTVSDILVVDENGTVESWAGSRISASELFGGVDIGEESTETMSASSVTVFVVLDNGVKIPQDEFCDTKGNSLVNCVEIGSTVHQRVGATKQRVWWFLNTPATNLQNYWEVQ